ncbi:MAG: hypothetical protein N3A67_01530 [Ignavibacteria bacterium]|nr:hypothetical protein [Ignavibacteria bacterium]
MRCASTNFGKNGKHRRDRVEVGLRPVSTNQNDKISNVETQCVASLQNPCMEKIECRDTACCVSTINTINREWEKDVEAQCIVPLQQQKKIIQCRDTACCVSTECCVSTTINAGFSILQNNRRVGLP